MKILLVAGGSGGHIYPCLELAKYLISKDEEVLLCGCNNSLEEKIYKDNNLNFKGLKIDRKKIKSFLNNYKEIKSIYEEFKPDKVILFGNYIGFSFAIVAIIKKIPIYLHEQNVIYGSANKLLATKAKRIYLSFPINNNLYKKKSLLVGNPKSDVIVKDKYLKRDKKQVLIVMGSLGSTTINLLLKEFIEIANREYEYHIVIGNKYYDEFIKNIEIPNNIHLYKYLDNLASYLKSIDLFVSRSGATTLSEITTIGVSSILIPSPYVKNNHQYKNARYLLDHDACVILNEKELNAFLLNDSIDKLLKDDNKLKSLKENSKKLGIFNVKENIYKDLKNE